MIIVRHKILGKGLGETLCGYLSAFIRTSGEVRRGEQLGLVRDADEVYSCHLHFEMRLPTTSSWGMVGSGYSSSPYPIGWLDPSNYVD